MVIVFFLFLVISYLLFNAIPGNAFSSLLLNPLLPPEAYQKTIEAFGLDKPLFERVQLYIINFFKGDFGYSYTYYPRTPIDLIAERLPRTLMLFSIVNVIAFYTGFLVGKIEESKELINEIKNKHKQIAIETSKWKKKPKVYFEEWDNPQISGIKWVSEIIHLCGGNDIFIEHSKESLAKDRIISSNDVIKKNPDIIIASWCGKKVKKEKIKKRKGWEKIKAVNNNEIHEIKSEIILQPGPASVTDGAELIHEIFNNWNKRNNVS